MKTRARPRAAIGARHLRAAQAALGVTGEAMAELMEVSRRQWGYYLAGTTAVPRLRWRAVAAELREKRAGAAYARALRENWESAARAGGAR